MGNLEVSDSGKSPEEEPVSPSERTTVDFEEPETLVGRCLDERFLIVKNLADGGADAGGIGLVYLATDTKLMGKEVVVKILQESALKHADIVRKFQHEKEALIRLDHPGIVRILDSGDLRDGNPFMVMDYIKGYSLRKAIKSSGQLPLDVVAHFVESITEALGAAHSEKILHRDIKPENIMLTPQEDGYDRVRLIDFGIARVGESKLAPVTEIGRPIGTVLYIAPEQLIGSLDLTPAADIYATAIVTYEMLTGELPFKPKAIAEMYQMEKQGVQTLPSELRPDIPRVAERILLSALEFDAEKRPQNARAFGRYLASELRHDSLKATDMFHASVQTEYAKVATVVNPLVAPSDLDSVRFATPAKPVARNYSLMKWAVSTAIVLTLVVIMAGFVVWIAVKPGTIGDPTLGNKAPAILGVERQFSYFLMVQKMRAYKPFEAPFKSSGQEIFESGYKYTMNFQSDTEGFFYIFNEGNDGNGRLEYHILYPTPDNNMDPRISAGQPVGTPQSTFGGGRGTEANWVIWTRTELDAMKSIIKSVNHQKIGRIDEPGAGQLKILFAVNRNNPPVVNKDSANQRMVVKGYGDIVVHRFELEHR